MSEFEIFEAAKRIADPLGRSTFLNLACRENPVQRESIEKLLQAHEQLGSFLNIHPPASQTAAPAARHGDQEVPETKDWPLNTRQKVPAGFLAPSAKIGSLGTVAHYNVLEIIGVGAFGTVLKAFDEKLERTVAIKVMSTELSATSPARKRFLREARASAAIRHENVVHIYSVEDSPLPYFVMEHVAGQTLQQKLDGSGPLELLEVLRIGRQIAAALAAAHALSVIHRDIKPENILLETAADQRVKITDFGLARTADDASRTHSGVITGTPLYMSPEQAEGGQIDPRTDLFSLGSVLYAMVTGRPPFRAPSILAVLNRVTKDTPRPIREILPDVPEWLCAIIAKLHAKRPDERFQSAKEVADLLKRCLQQLEQRGEVGWVEGIPEVVRATHQPSVADLPPATRALNSLELDAARRSQQIGRVSIAAFVGIAAVMAGITYFVNRTSKTRDAIAAVVEDTPDDGKVIARIPDRTVRELEQPKPQAGNSVKPSATDVEPAVISGVVIRSTFKQVNGIVIVNVLAPNASGGILLINLRTQAAEAPDFAVDFSAADIGENRCIRVEPAESDAWQIVIGEKEQADCAAETKEPIARIVRTAGEFRFHWQEAEPSDAALQIANCVLEIKLGSSEHRVILRTPVDLPAHRVDLSKSIVQTPYEIVALPRVESLRLQTMTHARFAQGYQLTPVSGEVDVRKPFKATGIASGLKHEFSFEIRPQKKGITLFQTAACFPDEGKDDFAVDALEKTLAIADKQLQIDGGKLNQAQARLQGGIASDMSDVRSSSMSGAAKGQALTKLQHEQTSQKRMFDALAKSIPKRKEAFQKMQGCLAVAKKMNGSEIFRHEVSMMTDSGPILLAKTQ